MLQFLETTTGDVAGAGGMYTIIMLIVMVGIMYFLMIRPENKRKKEAEAMRNAMKAGDEVVTIGGITGKVVQVKDDKFVIETGADQVRIEVEKWGIGSNKTAAEAAKAKAKKDEEAKAKAKAAKKAEK